MLEKDIENLIAQHPNEFFPNEKFRLEGQQVQIGSLIVDIVFYDERKKCKVLVEVKRGILKRKHIGQIVEYHGVLKTLNPRETIRLILCANFISKERAFYLKEVGIECIEITGDFLKKVANKYSYKLSEGIKDIHNKDIGYSIRKKANVHINKDYAKLSLPNLIDYLTKTLPHTNLSMPGASRAYRILEKHFQDFKKGKKMIVIEAKNFDENAGYFGSTTRSELAETARIFGYDAEFYQDIIKPHKFTQAIMIKR